MEMDSRECRVTVLEGKRAMGYKKCELRDLATPEYFISLESNLRLNKINKSFLKWWVLKILLHYLLCFSVGKLFFLF